MIYLFIYYLFLILQPETPAAEESEKGEGDEKPTEGIFNRLSPDNMHILLSVLHISLMVLVGRICTNIKTLYNC